MATFDQRFKLPDATAMETIRPDQISGLNGWYTGLDNQSIDTFLTGLSSNQADSNFGGNGGLPTGLVAEARRLGINPQMAHQMLRTREQLRNGTTRAFMDPNTGALTWSHQAANGQFDVQAPAGSQRVFMPGQSAPFNPVDQLFGKSDRPPGGGYSTADMVKDPITGSMIDRGEYNQRYPTPGTGSQNAIPRPTPPGGRMGGSGGMGGMGQARNAGRAFGGLFRGGPFRGFGSQSGRR